MSFKSKNTILIFGLAILSIAIPFLMSKVSFLVGPAMVVATISALLLVGTLKSFHVGVYLLFLYGSFLFYLYRVFAGTIPYGVLYDVLIAIVFLALIIQLKGKKAFEWKFDKKITIILLTTYSYLFLQIANPNSVAFSAWLASTRIYLVIPLFYIFVHYFAKEIRLKYFVYCWIGVCAVVSIYGIYQEYVGLTDFEWAWLRQTPERYNLYFVWGKLRKFSILSDASAYGLFCAFSALGTLILALGPFDIKKRLALFSLSGITLFSMSFSGTRTAYAMFAAGIAFYVCLNLSNPKILVSSIFLVLVFVVLLLGPFHNGALSRIRSTFNPSDDPSMGVRDKKRIRFRTYILAHPIGGGINTAGTLGARYSRGHVLAGNFDPDGGYLRTALETGIIGLFLLLTFNASVVITGIYHVFRLKSVRLRTYTMAFVVPFFALTVANFTQDALLQKPVGFLVIATYAVMVKIKDIDKKQ